MDIKNGIASTSLNDAQIEELNRTFNEKYPGIDAEISINLNKKNYDDQSCDEFVLRYVCRYEHALSPKNKTWFFIEQEGDQQHVYKGIESIIAKYIQQNKECTHDFVRPKDQFGNEYPDGRGVCTKCELELENILEKIPNKCVIKMSMGSEGVVADFDWGKTFIQGGESGIVISHRRNYSTAFFEAFPKIDGMGTFIRGEGESIKEAEKACWEKYQRMSECKKHDWSRHVYGTLRDDGYAQCIKCKMCTSDALLPTTTCKVCGKPTNKSTGDEYICYTHYFESSEDENLKKYLDMMRNSDGTYVFNSDKEKFDYLFTHRAQKLLFNAIGEDEYLKLRSNLRQIIAFVKHNFYVLVLDHHPIKNRENYTDAEYELADKCHILMINHLDLILQHVKEKKDVSLTYKNFIPEEFWEKSE
jgi:hypothetical protein